VPRPSSTLARSHQANSPVAAVRNGACLHPHTCNDQTLAAPPVAERSSDYLIHTPYRRIDGLEDADAFEPETVGSKEERKDAPDHPIIEIVDQPGLRRGEEIAVAKRGYCKDLAE